MIKRAALPLTILVNTNIDSKEQLLDNSSFNRLCIIGKSDNGRGTPFGIYKSAQAVAADYGVEAGEYKLASLHFKQFENGEVLIASSDYQSIYRPPPVIEPEPDPVEPEDDTDFTSDYISVGFEQIDPEPIYPEPLPEPEPEPEPPEPEPPVIVPCVANSADFNTFRMDNNILQYAAGVSVWAVIEIEGVDYVTGTSAIPMADFKASIDDKGAGYNANEIIDKLFENLIADEPQLESYLNSHTNYPVTSFDYGKRFSGVDGRNKTDLVEVITSIGGKAENFRPEPITMKIKVMPDNLLNSKIVNGNSALNLIDLFNKGEEFTLQSCLAFDYKAPNTGGACQLKEARFNTIDNSYLGFTGDIQIVSKITIGDISSLVSLPVIDASVLTNSVNQRGASYTGNQLVSALIREFIIANPNQEQYIKSHTNYLISSYDFSVPFSGIDESIKDDFAEAMVNAGGQANDFAFDKSVIGFNAVSGNEADQVSDGYSIMINFTNMFKRLAGFTVEGCLKFGYEKPKRGDGVIVNPDVPPVDPTDPEWTPTEPPVAVPPSTQVPFAFTTRNGYASYTTNGFKTISAPMTLVVKYPEYGGGSFVIKENGIVIFDSAQSVNIPSGARPFYAGYSQHHVIRSYNREDASGGLASKHTLVFGDRIEETTEFNKPIYAADGETITGYEDVYHPLLDQRTRQNNYTIESTGGGVFGVGVIYKNYYDAAGVPCVLNVTNFGSHCYNAQFNTDHHSLTVPAFLPPTMTNLDFMFAYANTFNQDIGGWDMEYVKSMVFTFYKNPLFNRDLSQWCLKQFNPNDVNVPYRYTDLRNPLVEVPALLPQYYPQWGKCPADDEEPE